MSDAGKGDNVAKRTNIKAFNDGYAYIKWGNEAPITPLPEEMQARIDEIEREIDALQRKNKRKNNDGE